MVAAGRHRWCGGGAGRRCRRDGGVVTRRRGDGRHQRVVRVGQPQQRQGPGRLQPGHQRRRADHPVGPQQRQPAAVAVRRLRRRLLPAEVAAVRQGAGRLRLLDRQRRGDRAVVRQQRHQPAVPAGRLGRRLRPADQPQQQQGGGGAGRLDRRRRQHRPVRRLERHQPAVAARPRRRREQPHDAAAHHAAAGRARATCRRRTGGRSTGVAGHPEVGLGVAQGLHRRPVQRPAARLRHHARHRISLGLDELRPRSPTGPRWPRPARTR